jgi:hypothetical protein
MSQAQIIMHMGFLPQTRINNIMAYRSNVIANAQTVEYGKFLEIQGDTRFPAISVVRNEYADSSTASVSSVSIYPKYAVITYLANPEDIKVSLSAENINVNLQDVETILNVISPDVTTIKNNTDAVESTLTTISNNIGTTNTAVGTINTNVADIETLLTRTNALVNSVSALLGNQLGVNGVVFCQPSNGTVTQNFNAIQVLSACKFSAIAIANSTTTGLTNYELPQNFTLTAPITSLALSYGAIIAFK